MRQDRPLPSFERLVAIIRQGGSPGLDQGTIDAILSGHDPIVSAESEAVLATLDGLTRKRQRPAINLAIAVVTTDRQGDRPATEKEDAP